MYNKYLCRFLVSLLSLCLPAIITACNSDDELDFVIVKDDTGTYVNKEKIMTDFETLTSNNIRVRKSFRILNTQKTAIQGMAVYNNYMFQCRHSNNVIDVYDLTNKKISFSITCKAENSVHCNNVDFSNVFYDENDPFPLLYLEHRGETHKTSVYRIIYSEGEYTTEKIQTLDFQPCSWCVTNNDTENGLMYISFGGNNSNYSQIAKVLIPDYNSKTLSISLEPDMCLDIFEDDYTKVRQDATIYKNKLFQLMGYDYDGEIRIIDLINHNLIYTIHFSSFGMSGEPEGIAWYDDHLIVSNSVGQVYEIYFVEQ